MEDTEEFGLGIRLRGLAHLLRGQNLEVPAFQRSYSWKLEQVKEYWADLRAALATDQPVYFLGTVVISGTGSKKTVIDGQQRLATTTMLLAAIRDEFGAQGDAGRAETIQQHYLATRTLVEDDVIPHLSLNKLDRAYFDGAVLKVARESLPERELIAAAFTYLQEQIRSEVEASGPYWSKKLFSWVELLESRASVIVITVKHDADAFVIFETLNDRGLELTVADLIKNYLLGLARSDIDIAEASWLSAVRSIEESAGPTEFTSFIRQWWSSRNGATRERDIYRRIASTIKSRDAALGALAELAVSAPLYAGLLNPDHSSLSHLDDRTRGHLWSLLELGLEQYRPLALAVVTKLDLSEVAEVVEAMVSWSVRGLIVGGIGGGSAERNYAEAAVRVSNDRARAVEHILLDLEGIVPGDREFSNAFQTRRVLRTSYLNYFLRALASRNALPEASVANAVAVPLMPRRDVGEQWGALVDEESRLTLSGRLGNFALIERPLARDLPLGADERLAFFETHDLLARAGNGWVSPTAGTIERRQAAMSQIAVEIWPRFGQA